MELRLEIASFIEMAGDNPRIGPAHISLFLVLLHLREKIGNPVAAYSSELRHLSKIGSRRLYYQVMKDLREGHFIRVKASYNPGIRSEIFIRKLDCE